MKGLTKPEIEELFYTNFFDTSNINYMNDSDKFIAELESSHFHCLKSEFWDLIHTDSIKATNFSVAVDICLESFEGAEDFIRFQKLINESATNKRTQAIEEFLFNSIVTEQPDYSIESLDRIILGQFAKGSPKPLCDHVKKYHYSLTKPLLENLCAAWTGPKITKANAFNVGTVQFILDEIQEIEKASTLLISSKVEEIYQSQVAINHYYLLKLKSFNKAETRSLIQILADYLGIEPVSKVDSKVIFTLQTTRYEKAENFEKNLLEAINFAFSDHFILDPHTDESLDQFATQFKRFLLNENLHSTLPVGLANKKVKI